MQDPNEIKVAVIVPCYNHGRYLGECLDSVLAQTFQNWECWVIDNGSTDNTLQVCRTYSSKDARIHFIRTDQCGVSKARNLGIEQTAAEFILPLDADDKIAKDYLSLALGVYQKQNDLKFVYGEAELFGERTGKWKLPCYNYRDLLIENMLFCSGLMRRRDILEAGGYSEAMQEGFEDWEFFIRLLNKDSKVYRIPKTLFYYRIRLGSRNNSLEQEKQLKLRKRIFDLHKNIYETQFSTDPELFDKIQRKRESKNSVGWRKYMLAAMLLKPLRVIRKLIAKP